MPGSLPRTWPHWSSKRQPWAPPRSIPAPTPTQLISMAQVHRKHLFRMGLETRWLWYSSTFSKICPLFCIRVYPKCFWLFPWHTQVTQEWCSRLCPSQPEGFKEGQLWLPDSTIFSRVKINICLGYFFANIFILYCQGEPDFFLRSCDLGAQLWQLVPWLGIEK